MTVRHHAYGFDPSAYLASVRRSCPRGEALHPEALRAEAEAIARGASGVARKALEYLRYDEQEWLHPSEAEPAWREWLVVLLVPHLTPLPSLSHREPHGYFVLDRVLPVVGWPRSDVDLLLRGESLDTLAPREGAPELGSLFQDLRQYGGWVDPASVGRLRSALERVERHFLQPGEAERRALGDWLEARPSPPAQVLAAAHADALDMLDGVGGGGRALFLLFE